MLINGFRQKKLKILSIHGILSNSQGFVSFKEHIIIIISWGMLIYVYFLYLGIGSWIKSSYYQFDLLASCFHFIDCDHGL